MFLLLEMQVKTVYPQLTDISMFHISRETKQNKQSRQDTPAPTPHCALGESEDTNV